MDQELTLKVQRCELEILSQIDALCKKYDLTYFAIGGTALGAVRHQGFIPWDDDIDVGMPRADYEKFLEVAIKELPQEYHVQHFRTEPNTPFYFTKIRKNGTKFVEYYLRDYPMHQGIFVDIFPFDVIPDEEGRQKRQYRMGRLYYQLFLSKSLNQVCSSRLELLGDYQKNYKYYMRKILHLFLKPVSKDWLYRKLDAWCRRYNGTESSGMGHVVRRRLAVSYEMLYPVRQLPFDGALMPVPADYDAYLKNQFGDYWELPPEEKRYGHLPYLVEVD